MRRFARWIGWALLALLLLGGLFWLTRGYFLDRTYYRGPVTDHYDGQRFRNPTGDGDQVNPFTVGLDRIWRTVTGQRGDAWPETIPVTPMRPPARVDGRAIRATWVGHATVLIQTQGLNILTDPIWSDVAGPWNRVGPRRVRAPGVRFEDLPRIDLVLVSHNHYDHMDLPTLRRLWQRDRPLIVTGLGNDAILRDAGIAAQARDWGGRVAVRPGVSVIVERVQHWSSRWGEDRNRALWSGFTIALPGGNIFFAGDTGWGDGSWSRAAALHGPFRLAVLPIGAYHPREVFGQSHVDPAEAVRVLGLLGAQKALGIHWGTFHLTDEGPDVPPRELSAQTKAAGVAADRFVTIQPGQAIEVAGR